MTLIKRLVGYIETNKIDYNFIASELDIDEQELKRMLYWDEDLLVSELEDIMAVVGITFNDLFEFEIPKVKEFSLDNSINILMDNLSNEEKDLLEQLINLIETESNLLSPIQVKKGLIN